MVAAGAIEVFVIGFQEPIVHTVRLAPRRGIGAEDDLLARLFGETPVNPAAAHGPVRPLAQIKRLDAPLSKVATLMESTVTLLRDKGFDVKDDSG